MKGDFSKRERGKIGVGKVWEWRPSIQVCYNKEWMMPIEEIQSFRL